MARARASALVVALTVLAIVGVGCGTQDLAMKQSHEVRDVLPRNFDDVKAPVTISWKSDGRLADGLRYMVFVDRLPMAPNENVQALTDDTCKLDPKCPNKAYLNANFIYPTRANKVAVAALPFQGPFPVLDLSDLHRATIVTVDRAGNRVGEQAWTTVFYVHSAF